MKRTFTALVVFYIAFGLFAQTGNLGLHGKVTWLSDTKIRVEYDWTDDSQLLDWIPTDGSTLIRGNGILTISGGVASVHSMILKRPMKCTRIYAQDAKALNAEKAHLNFITNVTGWTGFDFNPQEIIGVIYSATENYWLEDESFATFGAQTIALGNKYTIEINITGSEITAKSSLSSNVYTHDLSSLSDADREVAIGGWGGDTEWGTLTIEGEVNTTWQARTDMIDIMSGGATFSPVIEVTGSPLIEWIFYDGTTSSAANPIKDYGSPGVRHNLLKVTPWSALIGINTGYDAADGGYGGFDLIPTQNIQGISNLHLAREGLQYLCASYSPLAELDLSELGALRFIELLLCHNLNTVKLGNHPMLERICLEDCNLKSLDISGCQALEDFRASSNRYPAISWGTTGSNLWHICIRSNPQMVSNIPALTQFPLLRDLLIWDDNQTGPLVCHSTQIVNIEAYDNQYTSADLSGCTALEKLMLSGSHLSSINLSGTGDLVFAELKDCNLVQSLVDYVLKTLDEAGGFDGYLDLTENSAPSSTALVHYNNLISKGWTVTVTDPDQEILVKEISLSGEGGRTSIITDGGTLQLEALVLPAFAWDNTLTWTVSYGSKLATVIESGLVTASGNGVVRIRATANDGSGVYGEITITITNQKKDNELDFNIGKIIVTSSELNILFEQNFVSWKASLYNLKGNMIQSRLVEGNQMTFDISHLSPGLYIIMLSRGNTIRVAEFVKP
jgi:Leucine-rich repeat (LRR) protein